MLKFTVVTDSGRHKSYSHGLDGKEYEIAYVHSGLGMKEGYVALAIKAVKEGKE